MKDNLKTKKQISYVHFSAYARRAYQKLDFILLYLLLAVGVASLFIIYSATNQNWHMVIQQLSRFILAGAIMLILAQIPPDKLRSWSVTLFTLTILLLIMVLIIGHIGKGAKRWLNLGLFHFQPSELILIVLPMMLAWYFENKSLPPKIRYVFTAMLLILMPAILTAKQPDLGTAILLASAGLGVIVLTGINWRFLFFSVLLVTAAIPFIWHHLHDYQKARIMMFLNPESDPLGRGYHIIQSKIAIGSGGLFGKGWLNGTQAHLQYLPEHATDFIFALCAEEFGFIGCLLLISLYFFIVMRCLYIAYQAQDTFTRLLAGSLTLTFFFSFFINIGMVTGLLPVVGLPLPLISYGGTSIVTCFASFGIIMSIQKHRKLVGS